MLDIEPFLGGVVEGAFERADVINLVKFCWLSMMGDVLWPWGSPLWKIRLGLEVLQSVQDPC